MMKKIKGHCNIFLNPSFSGRNIKYPNVETIKIILNLKILKLLEQIVVMTRSQVCKLDICAHCLTAEHSLAVKYNSDWCMVKEIY